MELMTEIRPTETTPGGTALSFGSDRSLDEPSGDSVLKVQGERGGQQVLDAAYVEVDETEARVCALILEQIKAPGEPIVARIAEAITAEHGTPTHQARKIAEVSARAWWDFFATEFGNGASEKVPALAERFQRAAKTY